MKKVIVTLLILLSVFPVMAKNVDWINGGRVSYSLQKKCSPVVTKAIEIFNASIKGKDSGSEPKLKVEVYQLDKTSNKEMKALGAMQIPVMKFITKKDAFWVGVRNGKVIVVGSNGRGAAYGVMNLSKLPSVVDEKYETLQIPSVEYRAIDLEGFGDVNYEQLFALMLSLRANTLCEGWDDGEAPSHFLHGLKTLAEEYGIVLATPHGSNSLRLLEHKSNKSIDIVCHDDNYGYMEPSDDNNKSGGVVYHLSYSGQPHDYLWLCTTQPGLIANEMKTAFANGADDLWMVAIHDPVVASYQLKLFMDLSWNVNSVKENNVGKHLHGWLSEKFGKQAADKLVAPLSQYFRLVGIRKPEFMDFSKQLMRSKNNRYGDGGVKNTEFNAEEFGNELERYLNDYNNVCKQVERSENLIDASLRDEFFVEVEYPVFCSALMAVKALQAQESRLIGRPVSFHHDSEALESAARSVKAYRKILDLTERYNNIVSKSSWNVKMNAAPHGLAIFGEPVLTDKLNEDEIKKYGNYDSVDAPLSDDNTIVKNAYEFSKASSGARKVDLLGRSLSAIDLYSGDSLSYDFSSGVLGGVLRMAFIPTHALDGGSLQCSVSIDGNKPRTVIVTDGSTSAKWADGVLRGQTVVTLPVSLQAGRHTLTIKALSDHVVLDQWMIDKDTDRQFYVMPKY